MSSKCCLESSSQIASEAIWESKFSRGGGLPPDPPSRHAHLCVRERAFTRYYHPATILFPPRLKILYETLIKRAPRQLLSWEQGIRDSAHDQNSIKIKSFNHWRLHVKSVCRRSTSTLSDPGMTCSFCLWMLGRNGEVINHIMQNFLRKKQVNII